MRKKIIFASAVSCLFLSSANASVVDKPNGWYLKGAYEDLFASSKYRSLGSARYGSLSSVGAALGYKQGYLRGEGSLGYGRMHEKTFISSCNRGICTTHKWGHNLNLGLHGFLDFDNQTIISPYVGIGLEKNTWNGILIRHANRVQSVGLVGARAYLTNNLALDVGYKTNLAHMGNGGVGSIGLAWHFD